MNIDTANLIKYVIENCSIKDKVKIFIDSSEAKRKWYYKITFEVGLLNEYVLPHIENVGKSIGNICGEGLWANYFDNKLKLVLS